MRFSVSLSTLALLASPSSLILASPHHNPAPTFPPLAKTKNGTLQGFRLPAFNEDVFFAVPFAAPPVGDLRLRHPEPYNTAWKGVRDATVRSPSCPGYAGFDVGLALGEGMKFPLFAGVTNGFFSDCLTLDIVRPSGTKPGDKLPILVWIYGGGI